MKLSIKPISSMDIGALREMSMDFWEEGGAEYPYIDDAEIDKAMMMVLANMADPEFIYLIAYDGKKPAGFLLCYMGNKPYSKPARVAVAQELYVVPEKRSGLVGLKLMEEAGRLAIEKGAEGFECLGTYNGTDKRWEKFGFKPHVTYGHMDPDDFMAIVRRFTRGRDAA
jgi:GNAT superfamily N-acetyltransferase